MGLILAIALIVLLLKKAATDAALDHEYAKRGEVSPRLAHKYGGADKARAKVARYGFFDHLRDSYRDAWARRTDATIAARNARAADGRRVTLRERLAAARTRLVDTDRAPDEPAAVVPEAAPATRTRAVVVDPATPAAPTVVPEQRQPEATQPEPFDQEAEPAAAPQPEPVPTEPAPEQAAEPVADPGQVPTVDTTAEQRDAAVDLNPLNQPTATADVTDADPDEITEEATPGGTDVTAPTGEVVNYETAIAENEAMQQAVKAAIDAGEAALASMGQAKVAVEEVQTVYTPTADAAVAKLDALTAMGLDTTTIAHASAQVEALPVGKVDALYDAVEETEAHIRSRVAQAHAALAALQAERAELEANYAAASETVATNLGGDPTFVGSSSSSSPQMANA